MLKTLRLGSRGPEVKAWETFLVGQGFPEIEVDEVFNAATQQATRSFQKANRLEMDGVVGPKTYAAALALGFPAVVDDDSEQQGPNWPPRPTYLPPYAADREKLFGKFSYEAAPTSLNPEGIRITDDWAAKNIVSVEIPQLQRVAGAPRDCRVQFHAKAADQFKDLWAAWEAEGLLPLVLSWSGSWVPRFIRGSRITLSNHAWGTAFDINAQKNPLGATPLLVDERGSVRKLVPLAEKHGFYWGGWYAKRPDGMHFEVARLL